jgi:hypothetical protein
MSQEQFRDNPLLDGHTDRDGLAKYLHVTTRTIARWEKLEQGGLPRIELGGRVIYNIESVRRWIAKRERAFSLPMPERRAKVVTRGKCSPLNYCATPMIHGWCGDPAGATFSTT